MAWRILHWACRVLLGALFLYIGYIKIAQPLQFAAAVAGYQAVPETWIWPIAQYFPWLEVVLGIGLLAGWRLRLVAGATAGLLLFFTVLLTVTWLRGIQANCGCFSFDDPISPATIARDSLLLVPALYLLLERRLKKALAGATAKRGAPTPPAPTA
jgi:putative oxidoreductase